MNSNIYTIAPSDLDSSLSVSDYYRSLVDGAILKSEDQLRDVTISIEVPANFRYKLDTTFTTPIKKEKIYNDTIIKIRVLSFNETENFIDNLMFKNRVFDREAGFDTFIIVQIFDIN